MLAVALLYGSVKPEHFTEQAIRDPKITDFIKKIKLTAIPDVEFEAAQLRLIMNDGREFVESQKIARGDPLNPISKDDILAKFWTNVEFNGRISKEKATKFLQIVENLEEVDSVGRLIPLLVA